MGQEPPEFCPHCGTSLSPVEPPAKHFCPACEALIPYYPAPCARLAVLDGEDILLVKVDHPDCELWGTPGGMVEAGENPDQAAARELREETTLIVAPDNLVLFDARTFAKFGRFHKTYLCYAVDASAVTGTPEADHEVAAAQFWSFEQFERSDGRLLTSWPAVYRNLHWWFNSAREALDGPA